MLGSVEELERNPRVGGPALPTLTDCDLDSCLHAQVDVTVMSDVCALLHVSIQ